MDAFTLSQFLLESAERRFEEEEDEEYGIPARLEPVSVLKRVRDLLDSNVGNIRPLDITDMLQDVEDCLHYFEETPRGSFRPQGFRIYAGPLREDGGAGHVGRAPDALPDDAAGGCSEEAGGDAEGEGSEDPGDASHEIPF